jgi:hypothetical protein
MQGGHLVKAGYDYVAATILRMSRMLPAVGLVPQLPGRSLPITREERSLRPVTAAGVVAGESLDAHLERSGITRPLRTTTNTHSLRNNMK